MQAGANVEVSVDGNAMLWRTWVAPPPQIVGERRKGFRIWAIFLRLGLWIKVEVRVNLRSVDATVIDSLGW